MKTQEHQYSLVVGTTKLRLQKSEYALRIDGEDAGDIRVEPAGGPGEFIADPGGQALRIHVERGVHQGEYVVYTGGEAVRVQLKTPHDERVDALRKNTASALPTGQIISAPMPGLLKQMLVSQGDVVEKGQPLCILEAMKMENEIKSPVSSIVKRIIAVAGSAVDKASPLLELETVTN